MQLISSTAECAQFHSGIPQAWACAGPVPGLQLETRSRTEALRKAPALLVRVEQHSATRGLDQGGVGCGFESGDRFGEDGAQER